MSTQETTDAQMEPVLASTPKPLSRPAWPSRESLEREERVRAQEKAKHAGHDAFNAAGFPKRHRTMIESSQRALLRLPANGAELVRAAYDTLATEGGCVVLLGPRGTGKTQIATGLARAIATNGVLGEAASMRYAVLGELLAAEKRSFDAKLAAPSPLEEAARVGLLVLDELHERGETPWEDRAIVHLFDQRYRELRRTILIANFTLAEAPKKLPASVWQRIAETALVVPCEWQSFRARSAAGGA